MNGNAGQVFRDGPIDDERPIRVVVIGAGVSGIALFIRLMQYVPKAQITIFEKNPQCGGTWYENRYPGVACDIPSHVYQYSFEPNTQWSKYFSEGPEILQYVQGVAKKYGVQDKIKTNTKVIKSEWFDREGVWRVSTESVSPDGSTATSTVEAEVVISAVGILNNWKWPDVEGLQNFQGKKLHSANWDKDWYVSCDSRAFGVNPQIVTNY